MYSRRTSVNPSPRLVGWAASSSCRCASTPSLTRPGSTPSSWLVSCSTSSMVITSDSSALLRTVHTPGCLDEQQARGHRQVGGEAPDVVDLAAGDDEAHGDTVVNPAGAHRNRTRHGVYVQTLTSRQVYANSWMTVREDGIRLSDGT